MSISILGGVAKGAKLATPSSHNTRPTSVLLKRRLFDSHQSFEGIEFYDICAGSGSMGIEAMSRGAEKVIFVESNQMALVQGSKAFKAVAGDKIKSVSIKDATQFDFYDKSDIVDTSVNSINSYLKETM